jgi:sarcosine oxidase/L-pipecolate oxidase
MIARSLPSPEQSDAAYTWATIESISTRIWKTDPVYVPHYHSTGFINAAVSDEAYAKVLQSCKDKPEIYEPLKDAEAFRRTMPEGVLTGDFEGWRGFIRKERAGWVEARDAMKDVWSEATRLGVTFVCDPEKGRVSQLLYSDSGDDVVGAVTVDGIEHRAHTVVLSAGASSSLLLDFENQLRPTAWTLAHIALTDAEAKSGAFNELPVLYGVDRVSTKRCFFPSQICLGANANLFMTLHRSLLLLLLL